MAYTISNSDGTTLLLLADNTTDQVTTSLDLVGRNVNSYGQSVNNNFIRLLENFASPASSTPRSPMVGQLWYNTTNRRLNIYDNGFKSVSGALVSASQPTAISSGDFWWDSVNEQLRLFNGTQTYLVGPAFPKDVGENGWVLPDTNNNTINDNNEIPQQVTLLKNYGQFVGIISNTKFDLSIADSTTYFNTSTTATVVAGLTIKGDIQATGQLTDRYLSARLDINTVSANTSTVSHYWEYTVQNDRIITVLDSMFPVSASPVDNEVGVPYGSECRVICEYSLPDRGMQVRRYRVINDPFDGISWQPYEIYSYYFETTLFPPSADVPGFMNSNIIFDMKV
jgi:hypothetical protein